jgi:hypothetical protein
MRLPCLAPTNAPHHLNHTSKYLSDDKAATHSKCLISSLAHETHSKCLISRLAHDKAATHTNCLTSCQRLWYVTCQRLCYAYMTVVVGRCIDGSAYEVHRWECIDATASSQLCTLMTVKGSCGHCCDSIEREGQEERLSHRSLSHRSIRSGGRGWR